MSTLNCCATYSIPAPHTHLLCHHGEHLELYPVELVEACPCATGRQSLEELAHGDIVETIGAVEHHALEGKEGVLEKVHSASRAVIRSPNTTHR